MHMRISLVLRREAFLLMGESFSYILGCDELKRWRLGKGKEEEQN
jgi:hypothetical protein